MENRRQTYRHSFEPDQVLRAELYRPGQRAVLACDVLDLSLGGMRARLRQLVGSLNIGDFLVARLLGRDASAPVDLSLSMPSQVVTLVQRDEEWHCGLRFLPIADPRANDEIERTLSRFLLSEQRRRKDEANRQR
ncbi:MAG TPA: PilZ domain-containing protein [Gemmataceae bacterium]|nr:PilZ domain-containing protein [Gemmataceae bacterium]